MDWVQILIRDKIAKNWSNYRIVDGGLPSVINVLICALRDAGELTQKRIYFIFKRIYLITFPHWVLDYKENGAFPEAWGLVRGLSPFRNSNYKLLTVWNRIAIYTIYIFCSVCSLITPVFIFKLIRRRLYALLKRP